MPKPKPGLLRVFKTIRDMIREEMTREADMSPKTVQAVHACFCDVNEVIASLRDTSNFHDTVRVFIAEVCILGDVEPDAKEWYRWVAEQKVLVTAMPTVLRCQIVAKDELYRAFTAWLAKRPNPYAHGAMSPNKLGCALSALGYGAGQRSGRYSRHVRLGVGLLVGS